MQLGAIVPSPDFGKLYEDMSALFAEYANSDEVQAAVGIYSEGPAAAYANVWEWGNARQTKKGPKTTMGINPDGEKVWLTITAPYGYIRVNSSRFWTIINDELDKINFDDTGKMIDKQIKKASIRIGNQIARVISETAPFDSGDLRDSIKAYAEVSMVEDEDEDD